MALRLKLIESRDACRLLQEEVLHLILRLKIITTLTELCKEEAKRQVQALTKCLEDKMAMEVNLSRLFALHEQLQREFSPSYSRDLHGFVESWSKNNRKNDELLSISHQEHQSERAKLVRALKALDKGVRNLRSDLAKAQQENDALCEEFTVLGGILEKHLFTEEGFGGETSTSAPTKKTGFEKDAGRSIETAIDVDDSSDGTPPHLPQLT